MDLSVSSSLGLDVARARDPADYRLGGREPRIAVRPISFEEVAEALRTASRDRLGVVPWGGGVGLSRQSAPHRFDVALDLTALDRIVEYEPEDMTLTAQCGVPLVTLRTTLAARGQELPLEGASAARATLGGVLASNACGLRRLRFGSPRDRILGARFALSDGTIARSGGKVVKNVAGYAIHRLLCGSGGELAVILEASLKLATAPERRLAMIYGLTREQLLDDARWAGFARLEPALCVVLSRDVAGDIPALASIQAPCVGIVGLEDDRPWVAEQEARTREALGAPGARLEDDAVLALWAGVLDAIEGRGSRLAFTCAHRKPSAALRALPEPASFAFDLMAGRLHWIDAPELGPESAEALWEGGFTCVEPVGAPDPTPAIARQTAITALRARIGQALDPAATLARRQA